MSPRMLGARSSVRNVTVAMILAAAVLALTHTWAYSRGLDANTQAVYNAIDAATWATTVAEVRTAQLSERLGVSDRAIRACLLSYDAELHAELEARLEYRWPERVVMGDGS